MKLRHRLRVSMIDGEVIVAAADDKMVAALPNIKMDRLAVLHDDEMNVKAIVNPRHIVSVKLDVAPEVDKTAPWREAPAAHKKTLTVE